MRFFNPRLQSYLLLVALLMTTGLIKSGQARSAVTSEPITKIESATSTDTVSLEGSRLCTSELNTAIDRIIDAPTFATAKWGILVESLESPDILYDRSSTSYFIPASNIKLLTTAAALQRFNSSDSQTLASLRNWVGVVNRDSNNRWADALLAQIGGIASVRNALASIGIDPLSYRQVDGSGLSRYNMATPLTFVSILKAMQNANGSAIFLESLPVAGWSGTLRHRFRNTPAQGRVRAKTGTLREVRALSGYLDHPEQGTIAFSILINQHNQSGQVMLNAIDQVVLQVLNSKSCDA